VVAPPFQENRVNTMAALPADDPRMIAWDAYKATEAYANSFCWAGHELHRSGSMWAAFLAGYEAAPSVTPFRQVMLDVAAERGRQDAKWGGPAHDDTHAPELWIQLICDYAGWARVMAGMGNRERYRRRMVQVAALAVSAIEVLDRLPPDALYPPCDLLKELTEAEQPE
jgi:hypothetical protein